MSKFAKLQPLLADVAAAEDRAVAEMFRVCPPKSKIQFFIMYGQKVPSTGTVVGRGFRPGYLRVDHDQAKPNGRYRIREVHYKQIL